MVSSFVLSFALCYLVLPRPCSMNEKKNHFDCPLCNLKEEIQVTGKVINLFYRSSLIFLMNIFKTFTTG